MRGHPREEGSSQREHACRGPRRAGPGMVQEEAKPEPRVGGGLVQGERGTGVRPVEGAVRLVDCPWRDGELGRFGAKGKHDRMYIFKDSL